MLIKSYLIDTHSFETDTLDLNPGTDRSSIILHAAAFKILAMVGESCGNIVLGYAQNL